MNRKCADSVPTPGQGVSTTQQARTYDSNDVRQHVPLGHLVQTSLQGWRRRRRQVNLQGSGEGGPSSLRQGPSPPASRGLVLTRWAKPGALILHR